jgi:multidrug transporter EmrE-like cation transporter
VFIFSLVVDPPFGETGWLNYDYTSSSLLAIFTSTLLAFCVNLSIFLVIGKTTPLSYNVLGHFKLVCVLVAGVALFGEEINAMKFIGTLICLVGVLLYAHYKHGIASGWESRGKVSIDNIRDLEGQTAASTDKPASAVAGEESLGEGSLPAAAAAAAAAGASHTQTTVSKR